jgi:hypothetical protein
MPMIYELAKQHRAALLRREAAASADVLRAFKVVLINLEPIIKALEAEFENDEDMTISRLFRLERYKDLQAQTKAEKFNKHLQTELRIRHESETQDLAFAIYNKFKNENSTSN